MGSEGVRRDLLARTLLEVLRDADAPLQPAEAIRRVEDRLAFTAFENSLNNSGVRRAETTLRFQSSWATAVGWITKKDGWSITEAGVDALETLPLEGFGKQLDRLYTEILKQRKGANRSTARPSGKWATVKEVVELVPPGFWTTYGDVAEYAGLSAQAVGGFLANNEVTGAYRVLRNDGRISPEFRWGDESRSEDPRQLLTAEGVAFDDRGRAAPEQRLSVENLRDLIDTAPAPSRRAWLVRGSSVVGVNLVPTWVAEGWVSLAANQLRQVTLPIDREELAAIVEEDYSHLSYNAREEKLNEFDSFINRFAIGDLVVANDGPSIFIGEVAGEPWMEKSADDRSNLRRSVTWLNADRPTDFSELGKSLTARLSTQHTVVDLTQEIRSLESLLVTVTQAPQQQAQVPEHRLRDATDELADRLLVDRDWIQEVVDLLRDRKQLIFYGPPGTGKTFLARAIAQHVASQVKLVQFHPAYSYEDFFEGYRPVQGKEGSGSVGFKLTPGPFRRLVDAARQDPSQAFVLIVDEINRANLAKVFGELYFLLEYRDESIDLLYSSGDEAGFTLPENVYLIGTMNTADRSIALVDAAMRRRFAFLPLHPSEPPTAHLLRRWLVRHGMEEGSAELLDELNRRIDDEDFKIGPSYFMRSSVYTDGGLERMWRTSILPLLEEHHFGDGVDVAKRYSLDSIRRAVDARSESTADDET